MGQRPSQCSVCGCFQFCLYSGVPGCAEDAERGLALTYEHVDKNGNPIR